MRPQAVTSMIARITGRSRWNQRCPGGPAAPAGSAHMPVPPARTSALPAYSGPVASAVTRHAGTIAAAASKSPGMTAALTIPDTPAGGNPADAVRTPGKTEADCSPAAAAGNPVAAASVAGAAEAFDHPAG